MNELYLISSCLGVGAVYVKDRNGIIAQMIGGHQEHSLRAGTVNVAGIVGFARSVELGLEHMNEKVEKMAQISNKFLLAVQQAIPGSVLNGPPIINEQGKANPLRLCNNISIAFPGFSADRLLAFLSQRGVCCR